MNNSHLNLCSKVSIVFEKFMAQKNCMEEKSIYSPGQILFRGLRDSRWPVVSSAARRLSSDRKHCQRDFIRYHVNLIKQARKYCYGSYEFGENLSDLEILSEIQHLGGATCLTDFTTNFLVSLWFATAPIKKTDKDGTLKTETDGKIVWLDLSHPENVNHIRYCTDEFKELPIQKILMSYSFIQHTKRQNKALPCFWIWEPSKLNERIARQESVFLFGLRKFPRQIDTEDSINYSEIIIPATDKADIRNELENFFGVRAETIFDDLQGYALNANGSHIAINHNILSNKNCLDAAKECIRRTENSMAISYLDQIIECDARRKGQCHLYCINPQSNSFQNEHNSSCQYSYGEVYFLRGLATEKYKDVKKHEAISNYHKAIKMLKEENDGNSVLLYDAYQNLILLYYDIEDYHSALSTAQSLWNLYETKRSKNEGEVKRDRDGHDAILEILELSIMLGDSRTFREYLERGERQGVADTLKYTNGIIVWILFKYLGRLFFESLDKDQTDTWLTVIEERVTRAIAMDEASKAEEYIAFVGYYYWNYDYLLKKMQEISHPQRNRAILLIEKAREGQNRLVTHLLSIKDAFD